ncbi:hypothetical protein [Nonomuraea sp. B1E8]|uniref:hypothetical protein n=1 Tax=unclassified Nonomuraea TaxID=2593643 RepID=UPI00325ED274
MDFPDIVSTARATGFALGGLGVLAALLMFLVPVVAGGPPGSFVGWPVAHFLGTPTTVEVPADCEIGPSRRRSSSEPTVTCPGAAWSVDGREDGGTLYGRLSQLSQSEMGDRVEARVFNGSAYLHPSAGRYGVAVVTLVLIGFGLLAALLTVPLWAARRFGGAWSAGDWDVDDLMTFGVVGLALAASAGAAMGYLTAEDTTDRLWAGALVAAAAIGVVVKVRRWRAER